MKPTSSKGRSPWKVKKVTRGTRAGGIVIPKGAVLINQGLGKIKLEDDFVELKPAHPVSMETENDRTATSTESVSGEETITEEFVVTKVELDNPMSSEESSPSPEASGPSSCSCGKEVESLKKVVKELSLKVDKQNEIIRGIKSGLQNAVMALMICCKDVEEEDDEVHRHDSSDSQESLGKTSGSKITAEVSVVLERLVVIPSGVTQSNFEEEDHPPPSDDQTADLSSNQPSVPSSVVENVQGTDNDDINVTAAAAGDNGDSDTFADESGPGGGDEDDQDQDGHDSEDSSNMPDMTQVRGRTKKGSFGCPKCGKMFNWSSNRRKHMCRKHSKPGPSTKKCSLCSKAFQDGTVLKTHIQRVHKGVRYKCNHCPAKFTQLFYVQRHEKMLHGKEGPPTQQCKMCGAHLLTEKNSLIGHMSCLYPKSGSRSKAAAEEVRSRSSRNSVPLRKRNSVAKTTRTIIFQCECCPLSFSESEDLRCHLSQVHGITTPPGGVEGK